MQNYSQLKPAKSGYAAMVLLVTGIIACISWQTPAQVSLANTKWAGTIFAPEPIEVVFDFKKDALVLVYNDKDIESMAYQLKGDTITLKKLKGASPCADETGRYLYKVEKDVLTLKVIKDDCETRSTAFAPEGYKKQ